MKPSFPTAYQEILEKIDSIDPIKYGHTRNFINGAVTYLSPYISRGVISTKMILDKLFSKGYRLAEMESFVKELCWRDYFQRIGQTVNLNESIRHPQQSVEHYEIPEAIIKAATGIESIDNAIQNLYESGYMHNHMRMYTAFLTCNLGRAHWLNPARWMYFHLLDGDWASNACSWQWVAGANSHKKYYANQENINKYSASNQTGTYLDATYEKLMHAPVPSPLKETISLSLTSELPETNISNYQNDQPTFVYNYYNLDPCWRSADTGNRILLLDPAFFQAYPISQHCIRFMLELGKNITGLQLFKGSFSELKKNYPAVSFHYKEHPFNWGYEGDEDPRDWITEKVTGHYPSFFSFWKKASKEIQKMQG